MCTISKHSTIFGLVQFLVLFHLPFSPLDRLAITELLQFIYFILASNSYLDLATSTYYLDVFVLEDEITYFFSLQYYALSPTVFFHPFFPFLHSYVLSICLFCSRNASSLNI